MPELSREVQLETPSPRHSARLEAWTPVNHKPQSLTLSDRSPVRSVPRLPTGFVGWCLDGMPNWLIHYQTDLLDPTNRRRNMTKPMDTNPRIAA